MRIPPLQHPQIGTFILFTQILKHSPLSYRPQYPMLWEMHPTEKIYSWRKSLDKDFVWVKSEFKFFSQIHICTITHMCKVIPVLGQEEEVIGISDVVPDFKFVFNELVKFIHVDIHK